MGKIIHFGATPKRFVAKNQAANAGAIADYAQSAGVA